MMRHPLIRTACACLALSLGALAPPALADDVLFQGKKPDKISHEFLQAGDVSPTSFRSDSRNNSHPGSRSTKPRATRLAARPDRCHLNFFHYSELLKESLGNYCEYSIVLYGKARL